jgi:hypothetical protein
MPLTYAIEANNSEFVKIILESGGRAWNAFITAVRSTNDDIQILKLLYQYGYRNFNKYDGPLHFLLNNFPVNIDEIFGGAEGRTVLYEAIHINNFNAVLVLLQFGANPNIIGDYYNSQERMINRESLLNYAKREHPEMYNAIMDYLEDPIKEPEQY